MLRLLVTPRWLAASVFVVIAFVACIALGAWQWDRAHRPPRAVPIQDERVVPLPDVFGQPADLAFPSGLLVRGTGTYAPTTTVARGTNAVGVTQSWSVARLRLDASAGSIAVVRGSAVPVPSAPVSGDVVVTGRLQPPAPDSLRGGLTAAALTARGDDPRGYLVLTDQQPKDVKPAKVVTSPVPLRSAGLRWQNSMYAFQWWIFGCFAVFAWVRFFREDLRERRAEPVATA